jgi:hypothetical protein
MRNAVLHLLTNKSGNFGSSALPENSFYSPHIPTEAEAFIRSKLLINESNYHLANSMLAVYAFPEILSDFRETSRTFDFKDLQKNVVTISGASYANTETENFNIVNVPSTFPSVNYFNWTVEYQDYENLVFNGCDTSATIPYTLTDTVQGATTYRIISAEWPTVAGIKGGFSLDPTTDWSTGNSFSLTVYPAIFPYEAAINYVNKFAETATLLTDAGLARNYYNAQSYIEKYATLTLALAEVDKNNPKVISDCK